MSERIETLPPRSEARRLFEITLGYAKAVHAYDNTDQDAARERAMLAGEAAMEYALEPILAVNRRLQQRVDDLTRPRAS